MSAQYGNRTVAFTGNLTEFDDVLISKGIVTKEQCLIAKGMDHDSVAEILVRDKLQEMGINFFKIPTTRK